MTTKVMDFAEALNDLSAQDGEMWSGSEFSVIRGNKFDKIIRTNKWGNRQTYAFVERATDLVYKPAGPRPAAHARFDLSTDEGFAVAVNAADPYGAFLYLRR